MAIPQRKTRTHSFSCVEKVTCRPALRRICCPVFFSFFFWCLVHVLRLFTTVFDTAVRLACFFTFATRDVQYSPPHLQNCGSRGDSTAVSSNKRSAISSTTKPRHVELYMTKHFKITQMVLFTSIAYIFLIFMWKLIISGSWTGSCSVILFVLRSIIRVL